MGKIPRPWPARLLQHWPEDGDQALQFGGLNSGGGTVIPKVVVTIPADSAEEWAPLVAKIREQLGEEVLVELTLDEEPRVYVQNTRRLFVGWKALRARFRIPSYAA